MGCQTDGVKGAAGFRVWCWSGRVLSLSCLIDTYWPYRRRWSGKLANVTTTTAALEHVRQPHQPL